MPRAARTRLILTRLLSTTGPYFSFPACTLIKLPMGPMGVASQSRMAAIFLSSSGKMGFHEDVWQKEAEKKSGGTRVGGGAVSAGNGIPFSAGNGIPRRNTGRTDAFLSPRLERDLILSSWELRRCCSRRRRSSQSTRCCFSSFWSELSWSKNSASWRRSCKERRGKREERRP